MNYLGSHQDVETTKKRIGNGICLVALHNDRVVGTMTLNIFKPAKKGKKWHNENLYGYASQDAVLPEYKRFGIGKKMQEIRINICKEKNVDELLMHTSIHAKDILSWWKRQGAQYIELLSSPITNYYAVRMRLPIAGTKKFSKYYVAFRFYWSAIKCIALKNKYGKTRIFWKLFKIR